MIDKQDYLRYKKLTETEGLSQREACSIMGIPRTTMQDYIKNNEVFAKTGAKILMFDIETSPAIVAVFGRHKQFVSQDAVLQEGGHIICFAYQWLGEQNATIECQTTDEAESCDDERLVKKLWDLYEQADVVVGHNLNFFDHPMFQARCVYHGMLPPSPVKLVDTYQMAKKHFRLPNNKLDSIAAFFGFERKRDPGGISTWVKCLRGEQEALDHMAWYCQYDVELLTKIFKRLAPYGLGGSNFNAGLYVDTDEKVCYVCGSHEMIEEDKTTKTAVSHYATLRCMDCGAVQRDRTMQNTREKRKNILSKIALKG